MFECIALGKPVQEESLKAFVHECAGRVTHLYEGITVRQIRLLYDMCRVNYLP
jgi:hypothetical protein